MWPRTLALVCALVLLGGGGRAPAQEIDAGEFLGAANQLLTDNLDDDVLDALGVDKDRVHQFLSEVAKQFQSEYVIDLAAFRDTARQLVPLLDQYEETEGYAAWLKAHLDYFEAAERLRAKVPTNAVATARKPSVQVERSVWVTVVEEKPAARAPSETVSRLKNIFRSERVPAELVWVAEVESSFNPRARSPVGAVGLYQLMPVTARTRGLSVGLFRDERTDPDKCARAAASYLRHLHSRFGDWRLALAAYNAGESRVADLLKKRKAKTFDAIATSLPAETQMFVPRVEAVIRKREGRALSELRVERDV